VFCRVGNNEQGKWRNTTAKEDWAQAEAFVNEALDACAQADHLLGLAFQEKAIVLASRQAIEYAAKAICIILGVDFPKEHHFASAKIETALRALPAEACTDRNFLRVFLYLNLWSWAKPLCEYPFKYDRADREMQRLIPHKDALMAKEHAWYCYRTAKEFLLEFQEKQQI